MDSKPKSGYEKVGGMTYFPRMLDKIRLHARGELHPDFHANLGVNRSGDGLCCRFLQVPYADLKARVLQGGSDEEILQWCFASGHQPTDMDIFLWNEFGRKLGWNDLATPMLQQQKAESGLTHRDDIQTVYDYFDVDEGRKP